MGRSRMNCMKITLHLLALCLLLSITTKVSGKPKPRHFLIETKEQAKAKNNDDYQNSQTMTGNFISGGNVHQSQSNGGGWGGGSQNSQSMTGNFISGGNVRQSQSNGGGLGGGSQSSQSMNGNSIDGGSVNQDQSNGGGSDNTQSMGGNHIVGGSVNQRQSNGGGLGVL